jgi:hypothetical protein
MPKELIMRGQTADGGTEILNFSGHKGDNAYKLVDFQLYCGSNVGNQSSELAGSISAGKTAHSPTSPDFNDQGLIGTSYFGLHTSGANPASSYQIVNDQFMITQNLILKVEVCAGSNTQPINWQCKFEKVKLSNSAKAVANFNQFTIYDE